MIDWELVWSVIGVVLVIGAIVALIYFVLRGAVLATGCLFGLFGLVLALALWFDAINGWPVLGRVAFLIFQLTQTLYSSIDQATSNVPELPNPLYD